MSDAQSSEQAEPQAETIEAGDFASLLQKEFKPKSDRAKEAVEQAVQTLAENALSNTALISNDALKSIEAIIAAIDEKLTEQVNKILHHEDFQTLEGAWRGLHHLVNNTETDEMLKIRVMNISKKDLGKTLKKFKGTAWDQSPIFKRATKRSTASSAASPTGAWSGTTTSTRARPTWRCSVRSRRWRRPATRRSSRRRTPR
jgi:type VI secretion system protein ImpC